MSVLVWWPCEPEFVEASETWDGGSGEIAFNHLQQSVPDDSELDFVPSPPTTDPWGITG